MRNSLRQGAASRLPSVCSVYGRKRQDGQVSTCWQPVVPPPTSVHSFHQGLPRIRKSQRYTDREFHFKEITSNNLSAYISLADWLAEKTAVIGFKAVSVERTGVSSVPKALETLFYHLLVRGVEHENDTRRAMLPRAVEIWKDREESGSDRLFLADLGERLRIASRSRFDGKLQVDELEAVDSKREHPLMQIADLFVGSLNRILNSRGGQDRPKDMLARHFLSLLGLPNGPQDRESEGGLALCVSL